MLLRCGDCTMVTSGRRCSGPYRSAQSPDRASERRRVEGVADRDAVLEVGDFDDLAGGLGFDFVDVSGGADPEVVAGSLLAESPGVESFAGVVSGVEGAGVRGGGGAAIGGG